MKTNVSHWHLLSLLFRCEEDGGGRKSPLHSRHWGESNDVVIGSFKHLNMKIGYLKCFWVCSVSFFLYLTFPVPGCSECLGSAHPCSGSQLARFGNSGLWTRIRVWDCRHVCVSTITVSVRLNLTTIVWYNLYVWYSQDKGSVRMITLTKTDSSQVDALAHFKKCCWSILLQKVFLKHDYFYCFRSAHCRLEICPQWLFATLWMCLLSLVLSKQKQTW